MKHRIDPTVDCVFKAILGQETNTVSLIHFLNSVLKPDENSQIKEAFVLNPYNEREFQDDKLSILDVKAQDEKENQYQIEIQLELYPSLKSRMLYNWGSLYHSQLKSGNKYSDLRKTISIWIVAKTMFPEIPDYHLPFSLYNVQHKLSLTDHMQIHIVQLPLWHWQGTVLDEIDRWMYLLTKGKEMDVEHPPEILQVKEMKPVMETMKRFSENEENYDLYESRRMAIMERETIKEELTIQVTEQVTEQVTKQVKAEMQAEIEKERKEKERLLNLLKEAGIDPGQGC